MRRLLHQFWSDLTYQLSALPASILAFTVVVCVLSLAASVAQAAGTPEATVKEYMAALQKDGMVAVPNVNIHEEMADLIAASRAFEANLAVVKNARSMAQQTLAIGRR